MTTTERAVVSLSHQQEGSNAPLVLRPQSLAEYMELARMLAESDIVPTAYKGKAGNVLVALQMGAEVGLHPVQALQSIAVINGKPSIYGDAGLGIVMASGQLEDIEETDDGVTATCRLKRKGRPTEVVRSFSVADAKAAQVYESDGRGGGGWRSLSDRATWKSYPKRMRQMRARWWALRDLFPDVLKGLAGREEVEDIGDEPRIGPDAAKRIGGDADFESMTPRRASEAAGVQGQEENRGAAEQKKPGGDQQGPVTTAGGAVADGEPAADPAATGAHQEEGASKESPQAGDDPAPGPYHPSDPVGGHAGAAAPAAETSRSEAPAPKEIQPTRFQIGRQVFATNGITKEQMLATFKLVPRVDTKHGKDYAAANVLLKEFGCSSRTELTNEAAGRFIIRLQEILGDV